MSRTRRRVAPALGLFALAPLIGECLLGNLTVPEIVFFLLPLLAPMYGGGALLIREVARRTGRGPATMLVLGVAYGLVEEGLADQMLFNRDYAGHDLMGDTYIPGLGIGGWLTIGVVTMHAVWSTNVAIALAEALVPGRAETPWLGRTGLVVTGAVFLAGTAVVAYGNYTEEHFMASPVQLLVTLALVVALVLVAFRIRPRTPVAGTVPGPWAIGALALAAAALFLQTARLPGWWSAACAAALIVAASAGVIRWSRHGEWGRSHRLALAGGALLAYAGGSFATSPESAPKQGADYVVNAVLAVAAIGLLLVAARRSSSRPLAPAGPPVASTRERRTPGERQYER
ncbi:MAG: hypothetical protein ACRDP6_17155 [Actinoallomurus sp.]